ncbi:BatD family protein [Rufibacter sediminis]|uniref:BatD family protein n=1 Tax=Rufibacter sediminis TaxID=2762756 RepID=A0ABR6VMM5_9BACT|nr:BatD family protein [Rufibacter sediminis]MBC3538408.1 BatD family protein [Rufibacter sediminis]
MKKAVIFFVCMCWAAWGRAQEHTIEFGPAAIPIDQYFTISLKSPDTRPTKVEGFPDIEGLQKSTQKSFTTTITRGTKVSRVYTLTQQYAPLQEGEVTVKPFTLVVDGKQVAAPGIKVQVGPAAPAGNAPRDSLSMALPAVATPDFVEVKENAFLTLQVPKGKVYVGEAVPISLWFYVADTDLGLLDFFEFEAQIGNIVRQLKQRSALEEVVQQEEILPEKIKIGEKAFTRYKLYEAILFPLTPQPLRFPVISLRMIKYKVAKNPSLLTQNRLPENKTYTTQSREVAVQPLPPHPLRDQVAVGVFRLEEQLSRGTISLNQNLVYHLKIEGEGNIRSLPIPRSLGVSSELEIYSPEIRQNQQVSQGKLQGSKTFRYFMVGRQAGEFPLRELFQWVYFNPVTARYDTLRPALTVRVRGQEDQNSFIRTQDVGDFYNIAATESNELISIDQFREVRLYTNVVLGVLLTAALFIFILKRK